MDRQKAVSISEMLFFFCPVYDVLIRGASLYSKPHPLLCFAISVDRSLAEWIYFLGPSSRSNFLRKKVVNG